MARSSGTLLGRAVQHLWATTELGALYRGPRPPHRNNRETVSAWSAGKKLQKVANCVRLFSSFLHTRPSSACKHLRPFTRLGNFGSPKMIEVSGALMRLRELHRTHDAGSGESNHEGVEGNYGYCSCRKDGLRAQGCPGHSTFPCMAPQIRQCLLMRGFCQARQHF